jgi:hypothetical protein
MSPLSHRPLTRIAALFRARTPEALDKDAIAELPGNAIPSMTREELIQLITAADVPVLRDRIVHDGVRSYERTTLVRLAQLGRLCCRNQGYGSPAE